MKKLVVFYSSVRFNQFNRADFIREFAAKSEDCCQVVVIDRPLELFSLFYSPRRFFERIRIAGSRNEGSVIILRPLVLINDIVSYRLGAPWLNILNTYMIRHYVDSILPLKNRIIFVWVYEQVHYWFVRSFNADSFKIWEIYDDYRFNAKTMKTRRHWVRHDASMVNSADLIFTLTDGLRMKYEHHPRVSILGNGFTHPEAFKPVVKSQVNNSDKMIVSYIGHLRDWIDFKLFSDVAIKMRNLEFVLAGPVTGVEDELEELTSLVNVKYIGVLSRTEVFELMNKSFCGIVPYFQNEFTKNVRPIKIIEYLSVGTPVLTTCDADYCSSGVIRFDTVNDFSEKLLDIPKIDNEALKLEAEGYTWSKIAENAISEIF